MKHNIKALKLINEKYASVFLKEALRDFARNVVRPDSPVVVIDLFRSSFYQLAQSYLDWESRELRREIEMIDLNQQEEFRLLLLGDTGRQKEVDWQAIEDQATVNISKRTNEEK